MSSLRSSLPIPFLCLIAGPSAQRNRVSSATPESCGLTQHAAYSLDLEGIAANGRKTVSVRIWSDSAAKMNYTESWQVDSTPVRTSGSIWFSGAGLPIRFQSEQARGSQLDRQLVVRSDSDRKSG